MTLVAMRLVAHEPAVARGDRRPRRVPAGTLFWRLLVLNGLVLAVAAGALVLTPLTISAPVARWELAVLILGLVAMVLTNAVLLRGELRPLASLTALMSRVDLLRPGERVAVSGHGDVAHLVRSFNEMLDRLEAERGASSARALAAQEEERQRIARELHDEIGQSLTAVLLGLKRAADQAPAGVAEEVRSAQEAIRGSLDEVRQVARRLRPGVLDDLGLGAALEALTADVATAGELQVTLRVDPRLPTLTAEQELVLYRITQEALTNVARHADAATVDVALRRHTAGVCLIIADDGRGWSGAAENGGVRGMRERAILIGAALSIGPRGNGGTEVRLVVPVPQ